MRETALSKRPDFVASDVREEKDTRPPEEIQDEIDKARKCVAANSNDADEFRMFLSMLGLPGAPPPAEAEPPAWCVVDGERARAHILHLRDHDVPMTEIAERAEVSLNTLYGILERQTARDTTVEKVCSVQLADCTTETADCAKCGTEFIPRDGVRTCRSCVRGDVLVGPARDRLNALHAYCGSWARVAALVGLTTPTLRSTVDPKRTHLRPVTEARILAVAVPESIERKAQP